MNDSNHENAPLVIIGTGLAGYNLAREFRKLDSETPLLLITADDGRSYSKPMLSTGFAMNKDADALGMTVAGPMAIQLNAEIRTHTRVTRLEPAKRRVWIGNEPVPYRDLVIAWGAQTIQVPVAGDAQHAIFPINDLLDYGRFREAAQGKRRVLILGAGLIGCEFANDLLQGGYEVDLVAPCEQIMPSLLPVEPAAAVQRGLQSLGARFHLGPVLERLQRQGDGLRLSCPTASESGAIWWSVLWGCVPAPSWPRRQGSRSIAASKWTACCGRPPSMSMRLAIVPKWKG